MTRVAVVLSGCGHLDGAEIREAVLSLLYLDQQGAAVSIFAPDIQQADVVNHLLGKPMDESRNVLVEAARIARGAITPLSELKPDAFDALVLPGGFGAAKNLSDFAAKGGDANVLPALQSIIQGFWKAKKPIGAICISPAVLALALKDVTHPNVTIGEDKAVAGAIAGWGGKHTDCTTDEIAVDKENRLVTCSAYMREDRISSVAKGIEKLVFEVLAIARRQAQHAA